ncbi:M48 family metallopeptidase [Halobellus rubicundus]|uniref:M48 family metallopeptidase n=1 Tax=Halobellus rubicundus TaxID=2996466 RepID=A0ABD5MB33_9EURY
MSRPPSRSRPRPDDRGRDRRGSRLWPVLVGLVALAFYGALAGLSLLVLAALWQVRLDPVAAGLGLAVGTLLAVYVSVRLGTRRLLSHLDAREVPESRLPGVYALLDDLSASMSVERPRLLVARLEVPNAFALETPGRKTVVVDAALLRLLDRDELRALFAHELAHLERRDGLVGTFALAVSQLVVVGLELLLSPAVFLLTGAALCLAWARRDPGAWAETLPGRLRRRVESGVALVGMAATLLLRAYARRREFGADARAAEVTGRPLALARALGKLDRASSPTFGSRSLLWTHGEVESEEERRLREYFSTHPPIEDRIARLRAMAEWSENGSVRVPIE